MCKNINLNNESSEEAVASLVERLNQVYNVYQENDYTPQKSKYGIARLFKRWFVSYNPTVIDPMHQEFLDDVEQIISRLGTALKKLRQENPDTCKEFALKAVNLVLAPKPTREKTTLEWYMTIAEYGCSSLLPYLELEDLQYIRDKWLKRLPKRLMYPKQRELLNEIEKYLSVR